MTLRHRLHRVLYVPLDDRPYNQKAPRLLAQMVDYEMIVPPAEMLGCFRNPGKPDEIADWTRTHCESGVDCCILSLDMLAYGGLVASCSPGTRTQLALERLNLLAELRESCPEASIYGFSTIMRLGSTTVSDEAAQYVSPLRQYSILAGDIGESGSGSASRRLAAIQREIPAAVLGEYLAVRKRNHEVNLSLLHDLHARHLDFLVYAQDAAAERGIHRQEQAEIAAMAGELGVSDRTMTVMGADQIGMCLLARFVHNHMEKAPSIRLCLPSGTARNLVPPSEDRPFMQSIREQIALIGAREASSGSRKADIVLAVNPPAKYDREALHDQAVATNHRSVSRKFIDDAMEVSRGRGLAVCDIAFGSGADDLFVQELVSATPSLPALLTYAGWNSASNAIGSALAHGALRVISLQDKGAFDLVRAVGDMPPLRYLSLLDSLIASEKAHIRLLVQRLSDDWLYQARVRPRILEHITEGLRSGLLDLSRGYQQAEAMMRDELTQAVSDLWIDQFLGRQCVVLGTGGDGEEQTALVLAELEESRLRLPWRRLLEMDMEIEFGVQLVAAGEVEQP
ncbi:MAG: DUF4127 family protein [Armatimonadetes bacterium]|nr:DUF4127 family protein [Armatimonadota bacterium]